MANTSWYMTFLEGMDEVEKVNQLLKTAQEGADRALSSSAQQELWRYAWEHATPDIRSGTTFDQFKEHKDLVERALTLGQKGALYNAGDAFRNHTAEVVNGIPESALERLVVIPEVRAKIQKDDMKVIKLFLDYIGEHDLAERYRKGELLSAEDQRALLSYGAHGIGRKEADRLKKEGKSIQEQETARDLQILAAQYNLISPKELELYTQKGLEEAIAKKRDAYNEGVKESKGRDAYTVTRESLASYGRGSAEDLTLGMTLVHRAARDKLKKQ